MTELTTARKIALQIMRDIRSGELADRAFVRLVDDVPDRDRGWLHELIYGTLRLRGRLDYILNQFVNRGVAKLDDDVHDILRLGAYQLLEMHSVPAYAAVSQSVELTRQIRARSASGLVNGVLQSIRRADGKFERDVAEWTSHPQWLLDRWRARFGWDDTVALTEANNTRPELYIRPIGLAIEAAQQRLAARDISAAAVSNAPDALRVTSAATVSAVLATVPAIVQDPAAGLVVRYAELTGLVADVCAAPGGKAVAMADRNPNGLVLASDISPARMQRLVENVRRIGNLRLPVAVADARQPIVTACDGVLLDAPCTGTGTFRRHPDGKWRIQPADLTDLVALQRELLDAAAQIVKPGGKLVYSTCSLEPEENTEQVHAFLARNGAFRLTPPSSWHDPTQLDEHGMLTVLPHRHGYDGAFAARMERVA